MKERRTRHLQKLDQGKYMEEMAGTRPNDKAKERFRRPAYRARGMIREQGQQVERGGYGKSKTIE